MNYLAGVYYKKKCIIQHFCGDNFTHCILSIEKSKRRALYNTRA